MALDNAVNDGQADARALEFLFAMESLKNAEQFCSILHVKTRPIVAYEVGAFHRTIEVADLNDRLCFVAREFERVGQQVGEDLGK